jgi:hypothetical protein
VETGELSPMIEWVKTHRLPAAVMLPDGEVIIGDLHLQPHVPHREGPESPIELLNRAEPFFAVAVAEGGVAFFAKDRVAVVSCATDDLPGQDPQRTNASIQAEMDVSVEGADYRGRVAYELPPTRTRTLDFLNGPGRFFALVTGSTTRFINRSHVRRVRPLD